MKILDIDKNIYPKITLDIFFVLCYLIPILHLYLHRILSGFKFAYPMLFLWFLVVLMKNQFGLLVSSIVMRKKLFIWLLIFILVVAVNHVFIEASDKSYYYLLHYINFFLLLIIDSFYAQKHLKYKLSILFYLIVALGIQAIVSIPYIISAKYYVSRMLSSGQLDYYSTFEAIKNGVGNNGLYTSLPGITILGLSIVKNFDFKYRMILIGSLASIFVSVIISTYFASVLMFFLGVIVFFLILYRKIMNIKLVLFAALSIYGVVFFGADLVRDTNLLNPIIRKIELFQDEKSDVTGRIDLAKVSFDTFSENPFFGIGVPSWQSYDKIGEHMTWLDYLANFGLLGVTPLYIFIFMLIKESFSFYFVKDEMKFYRVACFVGMLLFIISNFISPMITTIHSYAFFLLFYVSPYVNKVKFKRIQ